MSTGDRLDEIGARIVRAREGRQTDRYMVLDVDTPALVAALRAVLDLHEPIHALDYGARVRGGRFTHVCTGCGQDDGNWQYWPCPTVRAITTALGEA